MVGKYPDSANESGRKRDYARSNTYQYVEVVLAEIFEAGLALMALVIPFSRPAAAESDDAETNDFVARKRFPRIDSTFATLPF